MKLTKFVHSCILVEHDDEAVLFDPGIFSWNSGVVDVNSLPSLNVIVVSHKHQDHCFEPFIKALVHKFPEVQWVAPSDAHQDLVSWGVKNVTNQSFGDLEVTEVDHAPVEPFGVQVRDLISHWKGLVTDPGDTHDISETKDVLLLPIQAPWGTTIRAIELVNELSPKYIVPIHDWMWNDEWRENVYKRFEDIFADTKSKFLRPLDGQTLEINL